MHKFLSLSSAWLMALAMVPGAVAQSVPSPEVAAAPPARAAAPSAAPRKHKQAQRDAGARDLVVELREQSAPDGADAAEGSPAYAVSTAPGDGGISAQQVRVQSGQQAVLRLVHSSPMQWMVSGQQTSTSLVAGSATATQSSGGITQATTVVEAGHSLVVTPHWTGGANPVRVELQWQSDAVDERTGAELPSTTRRQLRTTVRVPLQQWVTIATRGSAPVAGSYSSAGTLQTRRALQLRVSLP